MVGTSTRVSVMTKSAVICRPIVNREARSAKDVVERPFDTAVDGNGAADDPNAGGVREVEVGPADGA